MRATAWIRRDKEAKSDLILAISPAELQHIRGCETSRDIWLKLQGIYASRGPARKATLLKKLALQKLQEGEDVREHINRFFDAVDKLSVMDVDINQDLLSILLLYSLPPSYENFRCAIESRDELPKAEVLKVKILEESEARGQKTHDGEAGAMAAWRKPKGGWKKNNPTQHNKPETDSNPAAKIKCFKCHKLRHKAVDCPKKTASQAKSTKAVEADDTYCTSEERQDAALKASLNHAPDKWCIDSGSTSHVCRNEGASVKFTDSERGTLSLASKASTEIEAKGIVRLKATDGSKNRKIDLTETLFVPDLRTNLMSVSKITDHGNEVLLRKRDAIVLGTDGSTKMVADRIGDLYYMRGGEEAQTAVDDGNRMELELWHKRMGHLNARDLVEMSTKHRVSGLNLGSARGLPPCEVCMKGKLTALQFPRKSLRSTTKL